MSTLRFQTTQSDPDVSGQPNADEMSVPPSAGGDQTEAAVVAVSTVQGLGFTQL